jgi:hypothetical protein
VGERRRSVNRSNTKALARLALAFAISPLIAASTLDIWAMIVERVPALGPHAIPLRDTIPFCYIVVAVCGLPLAGLFALLGWRHWRHYTATGFGLGVGLMIAAYQFAGGGAAPSIDWVRTLVIGLTAGLTALVFWWARYGKLRRLDTPIVSGSNKP